jgi:hypothetical protein
MAKWREKLDEFCTADPRRGFVSFGGNELTKPPVSEIKSHNEEQSFVSFGGFVSYVGCQTEFACRDSIYLSQNLPTNGENQASGQVSDPKRECENATDETAKTDKTPSSSTHDWNALAASPLTDMDVVNLDEAIFLFALRTVEQAFMKELSGVRERHFRYWKQRLPERAFKIVARTFQRRMERAMNQNLFERSRANEEAP